MADTSSAPTAIYSLLQITELLTHILEYLSLEDLLSATLVSRSWKLASTEVLWTTHEVTFKNSVNTFCPLVSGRRFCCYHDHL